MFERHANCTSHADIMLQSTYQVTPTARTSVARGAIFCIAIYNFVHFLLLGTSAVSHSSGTRWANDRSMAQPEWGARFNYQDRWSVLGRTFLNIGKHYTEIKRKTLGKIYEVNTT